jgi:predicted DNA-binding transcriptional regulator AlpA
MNPTPQSRVSETRLFTTRQVAEFLGVSCSYLNKLRVYGDGPAFIKIGARVVYDFQDVEAWVEARKCISTSAYENGDAA